MEDYQQEIFDSFDKNKKTRKKRFRKHLFDKNYIRINLSYEQIGIFIILFTVLLSVFFTLGVERGKRIDNQTKVASKSKRIKEPIEKQNNVSQLKKANLTHEKVKEENRLDKYFTIQVVTYKKSFQAEEELNYLNKQGVNSFVINKGKYKHICVGKFKDKEEAKKLLLNLRKRYKDCFIKKLDE